MTRFLVRLFGAAPDGTPALTTAEVVRDNGLTGARHLTVASLDHIPDGPVSEDFRPQVAVGTAVSEHTGALCPIWADVELSHGTLRPAAGTWTCSPDEFARRFSRREARYLDGERVVMAGGQAGSAEASK